MNTRRTLKQYHQRQDSCNLSRIACSIRKLVKYHFAKEAIALLKAVFDENMLGFREQNGKIVDENR